MKFLILSSLNQYQNLIQKGINLKEYQIYCDNSSLNDFLDQKRISYRRLDEFLIKDHWNAINRWGCKIPLQWMKMCREAGFFHGFDFPASICLFFSFLLTQGLKNFHYALKIMNDHPWKEGIVFDSVSLPSFPAFSGNIYLNYFLKQFSLAKNISIISLQENPSKPSKKSNLPKFRDFLRALVTKLYQIFQNPKGEGIWVYGSLHHLKQICMLLKHHAVPFSIYNDELNFSQWKFARQHHVPYILPLNHPTDLSTSKKSWAFHLHQELERAVSYATEKGLFRYDSYDLEEFFKKNIFSNFENLLQSYEKRAEEYDLLTKHWKPSALITDEDYALRGGFLAAYAKLHEIPVFCVSHAGVAFDFSVPKEDCAFYQSTTFVNSEYEKQMYLARGWDSEHIEVTGLPRYDFMISSNKNLNSPGRFKLLYCANSSIDDKHTPEKIGYLGSHIHSYTEVTRPSAELIFQAIDGLPIDLVIKPHSYHGIEAWKKFIKNHSISNSITFLDKPMSILKILPTCQAMVLSYWSTTMIEAALCGLPVYYVDPLEIQSNSVIEFSEQGFCQLIHLKTELRTALEEALKGTKIIRKNQNAEFYLGKKDGQAAERITNRILLHLNKLSKVNLQLQSR